MFENEIKKNQEKLSSTISFENIVLILRDLEKRNPYPEDIFISREGKAARASWNNCICSVFDSIKIVINEGKKE